MELVCGTTKTISHKVNNYLEKGWELCGNSFRTGNTIFVGDSDTEAFIIHGTKYTKEIAQAMSKREE